MAARRPVTKFVVAFGKERVPIPDLVWRLTFTSSYSGNLAQAPLVSNHYTEYTLYK